MNGKHKRKDSVIPFRALASMLRGRAPGQAVIQYTDRCNATCAQCGMRTSNRFKRSTLDKEAVRRMLDSMAEQGVQAVSFTGGEPLMYFRDVVELASHARKAGIRYVRTGTNGFIFKDHEKPDFEERMAELADTVLESGLHTFWISVDSAEPELHENNRGLPGVIKGLEKALPVFDRRGFYPAANLGINRLTGGKDLAEKASAKQGFDPEAFYQVFRESFRRFYAFVEGLGFTTVNACYPMSFEEDEGGGAVYAATSAEDFIRFTPEEKAQLFRALYDTIPEFRHRLRVFTPRSSLRALIRDYSGNGSPGYACLGGIDFFFIDAVNRDTFPCGYRGSENLGKFEDLDLRSLKRPATCKLCDWECFRDPSELFGPVLDLTTRPHKFFAKLLGDRQFARDWLTDLRYYRACNYFSVLEPPDRERMKAFGT